MKATLLLLALLAMVGQASASAVTVSLKVTDKVEQQAVNEASSSEIRELVECVVESGERELDKTACINEVLGDVHN